MAATTRQFITFENGKQKRRPSNLEDILFNSIAVGASELPISEVSGKFDFGSKVLQGVVSGTDDGSVVTKKQMEDYVGTTSSGFEWQDSVIDRVIAPPGSPSTGERYLVIATASGDFTGQENKIAEYNGATWDFTDPTTGMFVAVDDETDGVYHYGGAAWVKKYWENTAAGTGLDKVGTTISIADGGVGPTQLSTGVAGNGLTGGGGSALAVVAEDSSLVVGVSGVKVNANGILNTHIDSSAIGNGLTGGSGSDIAILTWDDSVEAGVSGLRAKYTKSLENANGGSITKGQVVYVTEEGKVDLAIATASGLYEYELGLVFDDSIASGASGNIIVRRGAILDGFAGLTPGKTCYVSRDTAGSVVQNLTGFVAGNMVYEVGKALAADKIIYDPDFILEY